jgi:hypothetical protein
VIGTAGDNQGDLDISNNVRIIGTGAGEAIVSAAGLTTPNSDRVFEVVSPGILDLSRVTLTGGKTRTTTGKHGGAIQVGNGGSLLLTESALVGNVTVNGGHGGGIYFDATGGGTILRCVITSDTADDISGGIYLASSSIGAGGSVTVTETVIVNNADDDGINPDVHAGTNRTFTSGGNNRLGNSAAGFGVLGDYIKPAGSTVHYVVTGVGDKYDGSTDPLMMSLRDAIHQANITSGAQEIWLPAWKFILTRERTGELTDTEVSYGDLDIKDSLVIRGIENSTSVTWRTGARADAVFELLGDYSGNNVVDQVDFALWHYYNDETPPFSLVTDGDDDGVVLNDQDDYDVCYANYGHTLTLLGVSVS